MLLVAFHHFIINDKRQFFDKSLSFSSDCLLSIILFSEKNIHCTIMNLHCSWKELDFSYKERLNRNKKEGVFQPSSLSPVGVKRTPFLSLLFIISETFSLFCISSSHHLIINTINWTVYPRYKCPCSTYT